MQLGNGEWIPAVPIPDTLIVNVGEMFEAATSGVFKATVHRVVANTTGRARISIPYFFNPDLDVTVSTIPVPDDLLSDVARIRAEWESARPSSHAHAPAPAPTPASSNPIYAHYGRNAFKGLSRSHRDVTARFYPGITFSD